MVFNFNQLILVWLYRKLYLNVLLKFFSAVNLFEDELVVEGVTNYLLEFLSVRFEFLVHLEDIFLAIDDVHKLRFEDLLLHPEVDRQHLFMLLFHLLLLLKDLRYDNFFVFLLFVEAVPKFTFNPVHLATSQVKELFGSDGLFLVEVASQLNLFLDVAKGVLDVVHVILHFLDLLLGKVLQHLYVMHGTTMVLEAFGAQRLCVTQAIIDVIILVLGANILVAYYPSMACYGPSD